MVDPTSELGEELPEDQLPACASCGSRIPTGPDHRVITWVEDDEVRSAHFCDERCRMDWDGEL
jgi:hypothetical protein